MLPLGHVAFTWATLTWLQRRGLARQVDYRAAAAAALLPDLIDKPISLTLLSHSGTTQGLAHTLLAHAAATLATARCKPAWLPYALLFNAHLAADQMWKYPRTLFYPFSGRLDSWRYVGSPTAMFRAYAEIITRPEILAVELAGLVLLAWVAAAHRWHRPLNLRRLLFKGVVDLAYEEASCA